MVRTFSIFVLAALAMGSSPVATAQPAYGDLVLSVGETTAWSGVTGYVTPRRPGTLIPLVATRTGYHNWVGIAPDNTDIVFSHNSHSNWQSDLRSVTPGGIVTTLAANLPMQLDAFELDHDDTWVVAGKSNTQSLLYGVTHSARTVHRYVQATLASGGRFNAMGIDRDPGSHPGASLPYALLTCCHTSSPGPVFVRADRHGSLVTLTTEPGNPPYLCVHLHPRSGDLIVGLGGTGPSNPGAVFRMNKAGGRTTLIPFGANAVKILQDNTAWFAHAGACATSPPCGTVVHYDLSHQAVLGTVATGIPATSFLSGVDVYGSRNLVCNQVSPGTVQVHVQSRHPYVVPRSTQYHLAASLALRPGLRFPNGEWLDLDITSPLFLLSAQGLLPGLFGNFQGILGAGGNATATVAIPAALQGLGVTVFVAGVIHDQGRVIEVTRSHWFVL